MNSLLYENSFSVDIHVVLSKIVSPNPKADCEFPIFKDLGSNRRGYNNLQAVLTHQRRISNIGYYFAWMHQSYDTWFKCDDEKLIIVTSEVVLKLS